MVAQLMNGANSGGRDNGQLKLSSHESNASTKALSKCIFEGDYRSYH
jgi:hypothetical protein